MKNIPKVEPISAREFCRKIFGLDKLCPNQLIYKETQRGYKKSCVHLLSQVLQIAPSRVRCWGVGLDFPRMPTNYVIYLAYYHEMFQAKQEMLRLREACSRNDLPIDPP